MEVFNVKIKKLYTEGKNDLDMDWSRLHLLGNQICIWLRAPKQLGLVLACRKCRSDWMSIYWAFKKVLASLLFQSPSSTGQTPYVWFPWPVPDPGQGQEAKLSTGIPPVTGNKQRPSSSAWPWVTPTPQPHSCCLPLREPSVNEGDQGKSTQK